MTTATHIHAPAVIEPFSNTVGASEICQCGARRIVVWTGMLPTRTEWK